MPVNPRQIFKTDMLACATQLSLSARSKFFRLLLDFHTSSAPAVENTLTENLLNSSYISPLTADVKGMLAFLNAKLFEIAHLTRLSRTQRD